MSKDKLKLPMFPFTYLKQDLSLKGVIPAFSPGINKRQFLLLLLFIFLPGKTPTEIEHNLDEFFNTTSDIDKDAPAFPFTTFIDDNQVIAPGISIYEMFLFLDYFKLKYNSLDAIANLFFPDKDITIIQP